ncbi:GNAT family N-acetyltransferase [Pseudomonadota bacterium]
MKKLDVFIKGELVNLCVPTPEFTRESDWYSWFNDTDVTRFLDQGIWPNTQAKQVEFLENSGDDRLILIIEYGGLYVGVVSLSNINFLKRWADIAIVIRKSRMKKYDNLIPLEAMARITEHGFSTMNLNRISAGQHVKLASWQQRLELIGYRLEGVKRGGFVKGAETADAVWIATKREDFDRLVKYRGKFWDGTVKMKNRIELLPKRKFMDSLVKFMTDEGEKYYKRIERL